MNPISAGIALALQWAIVSGACICTGSGDLPLAAAVIAAMSGSAGRYLERAWALGLAVDLLSPCPCGLNSLCFLMAGHLGRFAGTRFDPGSMWVRSAALASSAVLTASARAIADAARGAGSNPAHVVCSVLAAVALTVVVGLAWGAVSDAIDPGLPAARRAF